MPTDLIQLLTTGGPQVIMAGVFVWYLNQESKRKSKAQSDERTLMGNHLQHTTASLEKIATVLERVFINTKKCPFNKFPKEK